MFHNQRNSYKKKYKFCNILKNISCITKYIPIKYIAIYEKKTIFIGSYKFKIYWCAKKLDFTIASMFVQIVFCLLGRNSKSDFATHFSFHEGVDGSHMTML